MSTEKPPAAPRNGVQRADLRPALTLEELLDLLLKREILDREQSQEVSARATTLRSRVLKEQVGSVRSQAAARYDVTPAELVVAARLPHPERSHSLIDEDTIARALADASGVPFHKIDPLQVDNDLVAKTLSRPFARHHVVIPIRRDADGLCITLIDPFDGALRETLENLIAEPLHYVVSAKSDILAVIDRIYGFRSKVSQAQQELGSGQRAGKLV